MRMRLTVLLPGQRAIDLRLADRIRRDLWEYSPVKVDPNNPLRGIHRDYQERAYFEFSTDELDKVNRVLLEKGYVDQVELRQVDEPVGLECQNCGNVAGPDRATVCPNCHFRDISPCPVCHQEVPRENYKHMGGNLYRCPLCHNRVKLRFNEPMFIEDAKFNQPLVVAEYPDDHYVQV